MTAPNIPVRLTEIDGIRGWAALSVLFFHLTWELFGEMSPSIRSPFLRIILDGDLAVYVFFVLSGDALSSGFIATGSYRSLAKGVLKRYFRLTGPIFASCVIVYLLMKAHLTFHHVAAPLVHREEWLGRFLPFSPRVHTLTVYSLIQVYTEPFMPNSYNPFLWPMSIEMIGSLIIFSFLGSLKSLKRPVVVALCAALYLGALGSWYSLFLFGLTFSLLRANGVFERIRASLFAQSLALVGIAFVAVADGVAYHINFEKPQFSIILATTIVFCAYCNSGVLSFMRGRLSHFLGRISFPLYVTHFSVIISLTSFEILTIGANLSWRNEVLVVTSSAAAALCAAEAFARGESRYLAWIDGVLRKLVLRSSSATPEARGVAPFAKTDSSLG